jgi:hypothetical protein
VERCRNRMAEMCRCEIVWADEEFELDNVWKIENGKEFVFNHLKSSRALQISSNNQTLSPNALSQNAVRIGWCELLS